MDLSELEQFILSLPGVSVSQPFDDHKLVYSLNDQMFAIIDKDKKPLKLSLRCDSQLSSILRQKYDEVMPGDHLDQRFWNTIILSGQLSQQDIKDLIRHGYNLIESRTVS
jgi:predicted DNA-binding protein (MmcQ/YjbR family)